MRDGLAIATRCSALALAVITAGCGDSGSDGGRGPVTVIQGDEAIEAGVEAAVSLTSAIVAILIPTSTESQATTSAAVSSAAVLPVMPSGITARAVTVACPRGGSIEGDCRESGGRTFISTTSMDCAEIDAISGFVVTVNGQVDLAIQGTGICENSLPAGLPTSLELRGYREEWHDGAELVRLFESARLSQSHRPGALGCSSSDGAWTYEGDISVRSGPLASTVRLHRVAIDITSQGNPCEETATIAGHLDISDALRGSRFIAGLDGFQLTQFRALDNFIEVDLSGDIDIDCLGSMRLSTRERLILTGDSCPLDGQLRMQIGGDRDSTAEFAPNGLHLDYDGNGSIDLEVPTCGFESLVVCQ